MRKAPVKKPKAKVQQDVTDAQKKSLQRELSKRIKDFTKQLQAFAEEKGVAINVIVHITEKGA